MGSIKEEPHSPVMQTFLYGPSTPTHQTFLNSPTASEASFRQDSPILPPPTQRLSDASYPISIAGAYPTPTKFGLGLTVSQGFNNGKSYVSNWSTDSAVLNQSPQFTQDIRMSSILPDDMDLYSEPSPSPSPHPLFDRHARRCSVAMADRSQEVVIEEQEVEMQDIDVGPEVKGELPAIREGDFPYYPLPRYISPPKRVEKVEGTVQRKKESKKSISRWLKNVFAKYGIKRL
jgi:hypothetical protein